MAKKKITPEQAQERRAFIAGAKYAFEQASIKIGVNFGNSGKEKEDAYKEWADNKE